MFGRRRRAAAASAAPAPELNDEQILRLLHEKVAELVGVEGLWTLVPRRSDDTDVIFHGLKSEQIATDLALTLRAAKAALADEPAAVIDTAVEPTALSWTPAPISVWAEPESATGAGPATLPASKGPAQATLVA